MINKCFKFIIPLAVGMVTGIVLTTGKVRKALEPIAVNLKKEQSLCTMLQEWVLLKARNQSVSAYLKQNGYEKIAIYGMNFIGELLLEELKDSDIDVKYGIDKNADYIDVNIDVLKPDSELSEVDAVIVSAITYFDEIKYNLALKLDCPIVSLETVLHDLL